MAIHKWRQLYIRSFYVETKDRILQDSLDCCWYSNDFLDEKYEVCDEKSQKRFGYE
jgi:hypothetical protein